MSAPLAGVWTPWADVLCRICHDTHYAERYRKFREAVDGLREIKWPGQADSTAAPEFREKREGDGKGYCTQCGADIWVHEEIAQLTRLRKLVGGELQQTGGMCAALAIPHVSGGTVVVTNLNGPIDIGLYEPGGWDECDGAVQSYCLPFSSPDEAVAAIIRAAMTEPLEGK